MSFIEIDTESTIINQNPDGSRGMALISGGIDSPVASWMMMRSGKGLDYVHFHSYPFSCAASIAKAKDLFLTVSKKGQGHLYMVPFLPLQEAVLKNIPNRLRIVVYRRAMAMIAERIAAANGASFLVTGDSLGQVSSQTLQNLATVDQAVSMPILRPLIGFDKTEIIEIAKSIGTYDISIRPHEDCCTLFSSGNPATRTSPRQIEMEEKRIGIEDLIRECSGKAELADL
jgi:thiamine biosynthesis protein ThiI